MVTVMPAVDLQRRLTSPEIGPICLNNSVFVFPFEYARKRDRCFIRNPSLNAGGSSSVKSSRLKLARRRRRQSKACRRGTTTVEFAMIALPLFMFVFGSIEFGRALMSVQSLEEAARAGCRIAILGGTSPQDVENNVAQILSPAGISDYTVAIVPSPLDAIPRWDPVSVRVTASFADMSWLPAPDYFNGLSYTASSTLPRESQAGS